MIRRGRGPELDPVGEDDEEEVGVADGHGGATNGGRWPRRFATASGGQARRLGAGTSTCAGSRARRWSRARVEEEDQGRGGPRRSPAAMGIGARSSSPVCVCVCCVVAAGERDEGRGGDRAGKVG